MRFRYFLFSILLTGAAAQAETTAIGPLTMIEGEIATIEPYNSGAGTVGGEIELIDFSTGTVIDRAPIVLPGGRGTAVGFAQNRVYVGDVGRPGEKDSPAPTRLVAAILRFDSDEVLLGQPRQTAGDTAPRTIIGGFKSISGMDSETEVIEMVSGPILTSGETTVRVLPIGKPIGKTIGSVVKASDGTVVATFGGEKAEVQVPTADANEGETYVVRVSLARSDAKDSGVAVSIESAAGATAQVARWNFERAWPRTYSTR